MSRYDGLIIPRSYSEYINKTDAATLLQALQLSGVMDNAPAADSVHPVKSGGIYTAIEAKNPVDTVALNNMNSVTSNAVATVFNKKRTIARFVFINGEQSAGILPLSSDYYNDNSNIYKDGNKIKFRATERYLLALHIIGKTIPISNVYRLFIQIVGGNLYVNGIAYGEFAETNIIIPIEVNSNTEIYVNAMEALNIGGGGLGASYISFTTL